MRGMDDLVNLLTSKLASLSAVLASTPTDELRLDYEACCTCHQEQAAELERLQGERDKVSARLSEAERFCTEQAAIVDLAASAKREALRRIQATEMVEGTPAAPEAEPSPQPHGPPEPAQLQRCLDRGPNDPAFRKAYGAFVRSLPNGSSAAPKTQRLWEQAHAKLVVISGQQGIAGDDRKRCENGIECTRHPE